MIRTLFISLSIFLLTLSAEAKKETIQFNLRFGFIKGGEAEMTITDTVFNGTPAIHYYVLGRTTGLTDKLFAVHDIYETTVDANTRLPLKAIRNVREQKYRSYNETLFYHDIDSLNSQKSGWRPMPDNMVDLISAFFYFVYNNPMAEMERNNLVSLATFHDDKIDTVSVKYLGLNNIRTKLGDINTYVLTPTVNKGKVLRRSDGLKFFISEDRKIPVLLEFDMRVGALKAVLKSYKIDGVEQVKR